MFDYLRSRAPQRTRTGQRTDSRAATARPNKRVEASCISTWVGIRDSKAFTRNRLTVTAEAFGIFVSSVKGASQ
ncbi:DUF397 domain-containing protein [Streptomyces coeruleorubidus]|uniref:DUF397 domain-containing protein n=1 Tax=Streptomyces coeruleorubidus TaxID=116188 RepID=UPI003F4CDE2E